MGIWDNTQVAQKHNNGDKNSREKLAGPIFEFHSITHNNQQTENGSYEFFDKFIWESVKVTKIYHSSICEPVGKYTSTIRGNSNRGNEQMRSRGDNGVITATSNTP